MMLSRTLRARFVVPIFALAGLALGGDVLRPIEFLGASLGHRRHAPINIRDRHDGSVTSTNWSGYAVTAAKGSVTDVKGSWVVPALQGPCRSSDNDFASFWVGIDGYNSKTVEQLGTDTDCQRGVPTYYAWIEIFPFPSFLINQVSVSPGDVITAEVSFSGNRFTLSMTNETTTETFSASVRGGFARRSSAEWIAEAPSGTNGTLPLADFGSVFFGADTTGVPNTNGATIGGQSGPIATFGNAVQQITMQTSHGLPKAVPSSLSPNTSSFSVQWVSAGP